MGPARCEDQPTAGQGLLLLLAIEPELLKESNNIGDVLWFGQTDKGHLVARHFLPRVREIFLQFVRRPGQMGVLHRFRIGIALDRPGWPPDDTVQLGADDRVSSLADLVAYLAFE